jgi:hypothetical protein
LRRIEEKLAPNQEKDIVIVWSFGPEDEPHGKYGYRKLHVYTGLKEACTEEEELRYLKQAYDDIPLESRKNVAYWSSFEDYLKHQRCKCPMHSDDVDFRAAEIQDLLKKFDETLEAAARANIEARALDILNNEG